MVATDCSHIKATVCLLCGDNRQAAFCGKLSPQPRIRPAFLAAYDKMTYTFANNETLGERKIEKERIGGYSVLSVEQDAWLEFPTAGSHGEDEHQQSISTGSPIDLSCGFLNTASRSHSCRQIDDNATNMPDTSERVDIEDDNGESDGEMPQEEQTGFAFPTPESTAAADESPEPTRLHTRRRQGQHHTSTVPPFPGREKSPHQRANLQGSSQEEVFLRNIGPLVGGPSDVNIVFLYQPYEVNNNDYVFNYKLI